MKVQRIIIVVSIVIVIIIIISILMLSNLSSFQNYKFVAITPEQLHQIYGYNFTWIKYYSNIYNILSLNVTYYIPSIHWAPIELLLYKFNNTYMAMSIGSFPPTVNYISGNYKLFSYEIQTGNKITTVRFYSGYYAGIFFFYQPCTNINYVIQVIQTQINDME
ncbi:MAG: hypothetical protein ACP5LM_03745 [Thermoplasmata archaeon]